MTQQTLATQSATISEVETELPRLIEAVARGDTRILIQRGAAPVAALIGTGDLERLRRMDEEDREAWDILEAMRAPFRDVPPEEIEREVAQAIAEIRAERLAQREASWKVG
jgi:PHD/YefM family antitoxin component YafN of YafNO toxin-antitoxin module